MSQFEEMQNFVRIIEAGSITAAAEQMNTVKSAVSKRLTDLEKRLGITLLARTTRQQSLTDAGRNYYQHCLRILDDLHEVESAINSDHNAVSGRIRIAAPNSFGMLHLSPALRDFNQQHPNIIFDISMIDKKQDLVAEGIDLAIRISDLEDSTLIARKLSKTTLKLCASPDYLKQNGTPKIAEDLIYGHVKLHYTNVANSNWPFINQQGQPLNINLPVAMSSDNSMFLVDAAVQGKGIVICPDFICADALRQGKLVSILEDCFMHKEVGIYAVYPQTRYLSNRVRVFTEHLQNYFKNHSSWLSY